MASVRGMGVAVMISWCGRRPCLSPFSESLRRCCTPKRCCSSTMTSARAAKSMPSWNSAWVPTTTRTFPPAIASSALRRVRAVCEPDTRATVSPSGANQSCRVRQCCSASSSVGAIRAACRPLPAARAAAAAATTVLPQPTSPCSSRTIGTPVARSSCASRSARDWARVRANGSASRNRRDSPAPSASAQAGSVFSARFLSLSVRWCASSSSNASRRCAGWRPAASSASCASRGGRCR